MTPSSVGWGAEAVAEVTASDPDGDAVTATWSVDVGQIWVDAANSLRARYQAPAEGPSATIQVTVTDSSAASTSRSATVVLADLVSLAPTPEPGPGGNPDPTPTPSTPAPQPTPVPTPEPNTPPVLTISPASKDWIPNTAGIKTHITWNDADGDALTLTYTANPGGWSGCPSKIKNTSSGSSDCAHYPPDNDNPVRTVFTMRLFDGEDYSDPKTFTITVP